MFNKDHAERCVESVTCINSMGLHGRPADLVVLLAKCFSSTITMEHKLHERNTITANAKSLLSLLSLCAFRGSDVKIIAEGPDSAEAVKAIKKVIESGFENEAKVFKFIQSLK